jgi:hypothetical protein
VGEVISERVGQTLVRYSEEAQIAFFVKEYGVESWLSSESFIKKEDYYQFYEQIKDQVKELQNLEMAKNSIELLSY